MNQRITPFLWFDGQAEAAARRYTKLFAHSKIAHLKKWGEGSPFPKDQVMSCSFELNKYLFHAFDAGPRFKFNPTISFFVDCTAAEEVDRYWQTLSEGGKIMMPLDSYPWSSRYGWVQDQFGISWQVMYRNQEKIDQMIIPALMFTGSQAGRAEKAINFYTSVFPDSSILDINRYAAGEGDVEGTIKHARFQLGQQPFIAMDSSFDHGIQFNEAISLYISCDTQEEIDYFWNRLTADGGEESMCGWLKDPFSVSWQVVPPILSELLGDKNKEKAGRVMQAMFTMRKLDIEKLKAAYS